MIMSGSDGGGAAGPPPRKKQRRAKGSKPRMTSHRISASLYDAQPEIPCTCICACACTYTYTCVCMCICMCMHDMYMLHLRQRNITGFGVGWAECKLYESEYTQGGMAPTTRPLPPALRPPPHARRLRVRHCVVNQSESLPTAGFFSNPRPPLVRGRASKVLSGKRVVPYCINNINSPKGSTRTAPCGRICRRCREPC